MSKRNYISIEWNVNKFQMDAAVGIERCPPTHQQMLMAHLEKREDWLGRIPPIPICSAQRGRDQEGGLRTAGLRQL